MKSGSLLFCAVAVLGAAAAGASAPTSVPGVANPAQARVDYMLKCQGCHRPDGSGDAMSTPSMKGFVARFLHVQGGREFIARVPGVASTDLSDARLADVLNWAIYRFDAENVPADFRPYTPEEMGMLRQNPLRIERAETRARLIVRIGD
ncbi:MAG: cytochrome C [Sphingobium sp.]